MSSCVDTLGPGPDNILCPTNHCDAYQVTSAFHGVCNCVDWQGNPIPDCNPKGSLYPVQTGECYNPDTKEWSLVNAQECANKGLPWYFRTCYCCCTCFAADTRLNAPDGFRAIGSYVVGDDVLAADRSGDGWTWSPQTVQFSSGSPVTADPGPTSGNIMIYLEYGTEGRFLIATPNQLFALVDGKLRRADQLVPGTDQLSDPGGAPVAINRLTTGYYKGAIHHVATEMVNYDRFTGSLDGHLINTNGVVVGDYLLQLFQDTPKMAPHIEQSLPILGTPAYAEQHPDLVVKPYVVGADHEAVGAEYSTPELFTQHGESVDQIPDAAIALFTPRQEAMLLDPDIPKRGFSDTTNEQQVDYFVKLLAGFYPDVTISYDWNSVHPNVYGYQVDGKQTVFLGGEFLRLGPLYGPAMAIAIGFGVAAASGEATAGQALFLGVSGVLLDALGPYWTETITAGAAQFHALLLALEGKEYHAPADPDGVSAKCLGEIIGAALSGMDMPTCAGGPTLRLNSVVYKPYQDGDGPGQQDMLVLSFNDELAEPSASDKTNYALSPTAVIDQVNPGEQDLTSVQVVVEPLTAGRYVLTVHDLIGANGNTLNPIASKAGFKVS